MVIVLSNKKQLKTIPKMTSSKKTSSTILLEDKEGISEKKLEMNPPMKMTKANCSSKILETRGNFEKMIQMHKKIFHRIKYTNQSPICCEIENLINDFI